MLQTTLSSLAGLPAFAGYFALAMVLLSVFTWIYMWVTPHDEIALIKANNSAAALAFSGALIGFCLPLSSAITHSLSILDCALWGAVALVVQIAAFYVVKTVINDLSQRIEQGELAPAIFSASLAIAVGMLNAACMSY